MKILESFLHPINLRGDVRKNLKDFFSKYLEENMVVYDVGCGDKPFGDFLSGKVREHVGVDIEDGFYDSSHIDLVGTAYTIPVEKNQADAVISSQVIEHLDCPLKAFKEAHRILKPDGLFFLSFPFMYPIHAAPHDFGRYTEHYIEKTLDEHGFDILEIKYVGGFWYCTGMFAGLYLQGFDRGILHKLRLVRALIWLVKGGMRLAHEIEGMCVSLANKDKTKFRKTWTVDYVLVARKKGGDCG